MQWKFEKENGSYYLKNLHSGKMLSVKHASTAQDAQLVQWSSGGDKYLRGHYQQRKWSVELAGYDKDIPYYYIVNKKSNRAATVLWGRRHNGATIGQVSKWGGSQQMWKIIPVN